MRVPSVCKTGAERRVGSSPTLSTSFETGEVAELVDAHVCLLLVIGVAFIAVMAEWLRRRSAKPDTRVRVPFTAPKWYDMQAAQSIRSVKPSPNGFAGSNPARTTKSEDWQSLVMRSPAKR